MSDYVGYTIVTPATNLPVTLTELKLAMGITSTAKDNDLYICLYAAIDYVEREAWTSLINRTMKQVYDYSFPNIIYLAQPPCTSVSSITYYDTEGVLTTLDSTTYIVDTVTQPARVYPSFDEEIFPTTANIPGAVIVQYIAGYGPSSLTVPPIAKRIIISIAADMFEHIESQSDIVLTQNYTSKISLESIAFRRPY